MSQLPAELGYPNQLYDFPNGVDLSLDAPNGLEYANIPRGNVNDNFNDQPGYAGDYELGFRNDAGAWASQSNNLGAGGSQDLTAMRETAGGTATGTNRQIVSVGPVGGGTTDVWHGKRAKVNTPTYGQYGPVLGGPDHAQQLAQSVYQTAQYAYSEAASTAGMVSAV